MSKNDVVFNRIVKGRIFKDGFDHLVRNNRINLSGSVPVVIYGPNGTGKTSLSRLLKGELDPGDEIEFEYDNRTYSDGTSIFQVVSDSNGRHVASYGDEYMVGEDIRRELELSKEIDEKLDDFKKKLRDHLKDVYGIKTKTSGIITRFGSVSDIIANKIVNQKPKQFSEVEFLELIGWVESQGVREPEFDDARKRFIGENYSKQDSLIGTILGMGSVVGSENMAHYHRDTDATDILNRYHEDVCVVCDNGFHHDATLERKREGMVTALSGIDESSRKILGLMRDIVRPDVFNIEQSVVEASVSGSFDPIEALQDSIKGCIDDCRDLICNRIRKLSDEYRLKELITEYRDIRSRELTIGDEDTKLLSEMARSYIGREIRLEREGRGMKIYLGDSELSTVSGQSKLSTGEENFISFCFELIRVKGTDSEIIVVDDPISSFDSVFKSKVVFMMLRVLKGRKVIVLTHNLDTVKFIGSQRGNPRLYIMNNSHGGNNGFIRVSRDELPLVSSVSDFVRWVRGMNDDGEAVIRDKDSFLVSMIPFIRSYAYLLKSDHYNSLCSIMHYREETVKLGEIYRDLFGYDMGDLELDSKYILGFECPENILCEDYPLLNRALHHNIMYLKLRVMTEYVLINRFDSKIREEYTLGELIDRCLSDDEHLPYRVALMSKKTLINEFNHFESDLNIFQPSLDISDEILERETDEVMGILDEIVKD